MLNIRILKEKEDSIPNSKNENQTEDSDFTSKYFIDEMRKDLKKKNNNRNLLFDLPVNLANLEKKYDHDIGKFN